MSFCLIRNQGQPAAAPPAQQAASADPWGAPAQAAPVAAPVAQESSTGGAWEAFGDSFGQQATAPAPVAQQPAAPADPFGALSAQPIQPTATPVRDGHFLYSFLECRFLVTKIVISGLEPVVTDGF